MTAFRTALVALSISLGASAAFADAATSEASQAARMVSAHRAAHGLPPVKVDTRLNRAAVIQSQAMAAQGVMSHDAAGAFPDRMRATGVRSPAAENIGVGYNSLDHAFSGWQASHGHNVNMLNPEMNKIGLARAVGSDGRLFWTMVLSGR
jgi:uncharacterized protein YkwD